MWVPDVLFALFVYLFPSPCLSAAGSCWTTLANSGLGFCWLLPLGASCWSRRRNENRAELWLLGLTGQRHLCAPHSASIIWAPLTSSLPWSFETDIALLLVPGVPSIAFGDTALMNVSIWAAGGVSLMSLDLSSLLLFACPLTGHLDILLLQTVLTMAFSFPGPARIAREWLLSTELGIAPSP